MFLVKKSGSLANSLMSSAATTGGTPFAQRKLYHDFSTASGRRTMHRYFPPRLIADSAWCDLNSRGTQPCTAKFQSQCNESGEMATVAQSRRQSSSMEETVGSSQAPPLSLARRPGAGPNHTRGSPKGLPVRCGEKGEGGSAVVEAAST